MKSAIASPAPALALAVAPELYERVAKAYATAHQFNLKMHDYAGNRISGVTITRTYDLGREPIEIIALSDSEYLVIDQPRNFKDYFGFGGADAWRVAGAGTAIKMRQFYACHHLRVDAEGKTTLETQTWSGGRFSKDAEKSDKQLAKYIKAHHARKTALPHLDAIVVA